jgi:ribosomal protein S18 acetylase RimI-like enzyme
MPQIRTATEHDLPFVELMLLEAFFWDPAVARASLSEIRTNPEFSKLLGGWGRPGDHAVLGLVEGVPAGAAWFRLWTNEAHSYGFVDPSTPELGIGVARPHRSRGLGRALLRALIRVAQENEHPALSLSVNPSNPARRLYESEGFQKVGELETSWTMRLPL